MSIVASGASGNLPRVVSASLLWTGGCLEAEYQGQKVHGHFGIYLIKGSEKTLLIDTGLPLHWPKLEKDVERFLDGRPLDYVFATHCELPHAGLISQWLRKYPGCVALGDMGDYRLYYPHLIDRMRTVGVGDSVDLGDRQIMFIPAIWRDLRNTLWAYETTDRIMFVSDAFAFLHYHKAGECDRMTSEQAPPDVNMIQFFNERALYWTNFSDPRTSFDEIEQLMMLLRPRMIAPAHGGITDLPEEMLPLFKRGMIMGKMADGKNMGPFA